MQNSQAPAPQRAADGRVLASISPDDRPRALGSTVQGLSEAEAGRRLQSVGANEMAGPERSPVVTAFLGNFVHTLALLLWFAAGLSFAAGINELGGAIIAVIGINGLFAFFQERRAEQVIASLMQRVAVRATVRRDGAERQLPASELVPGDIVRVAAGDVVAADCILLADDNLAVDLSMITGETLPVSRSAAVTSRDANQVLHELPCILPAGVAVVTGSGEALVWATGTRSTVGEMERLVASVQRGSSMLERQVATLARVTAIIAVLAGAATLTLASLRTPLSFLAVLTFGTGVIVALVPEGLLPTLSVSLAIGAKRMADRGAAVRRLSAVEVVGSVTVICTDKTGTLTQNSLSVRGLVPAMDDAPFLQRAMLAGAVCNDARSGEGGYHGDLLDVALATWLVDQGHDVEGLRRRHPRRADVPFDASRRYMSVTCLVDGREEVFIKGAPEAVLELTGCTDLPASLASNMVQAMASGERVLLLAAAPLSGPGEILALVRLYDPPRPEVPAAVAACVRAGIRIAMLTGDHPGTARALGEQIGLAAEGTFVATGPELDGMADGALLELMSKNVIFARTTPAQKLRIVTVLRRGGEVVVVTGDGINDAPALRAADVGVAMGKRGTEVAKQAADIVLTDDNFATIVAAIEEGRAIKQNIRRFMSYVFVSNVAEVVPFLAYLLLKVPLPLAVMQALGISIGTDLLPALGLGAEAASPDVMAGRPEPPNRPLLTLPIGLKTFLCFGPLEAALGLACFTLFYAHHGWRPFGSLAPYYAVARQADTLTFLGIVGGQVGCLFSQRDGALGRRLSLRGNRWIAGGLLFELSLTLMLVYTPGLNGAFSMTNVALGWLLVIPMGAFLFVLVDALRRRMSRWLTGSSVARKRRT